MSNEIIQINQIHKRIFTIRGAQVLLDEDLADIYGVGTKVFNQAVKRNIDRFPDNFGFRLTQKKYNEIQRSQIVTTSGYCGRRYLPYAFTEQGVAILSAVLRSGTGKHSHYGSVCCHAALYVDQCAYISATGYAGNETN